MNINRANEKSLMEMSPISVRPAPSPSSFGSRGRGPRKMYHPPPGINPLPTPTPPTATPPANPPSKRSSMAGVDHSVGPRPGSNKPSRSRLYIPGWSIPKLKVEDLAGTGAGAIVGGSTPTTRVGSVAQIPSRKPSSLTPAPLPAKVKKDMLARFDAAVSNPSPKNAEVKAIRLRQQLKIDADKKAELVKSGSISVNKMKMQTDMDNMREKFLGDISSELGFGLQPSTGSKSAPLKQQKVSVIKLAPAVTDSWTTASTRMDKALKDWSTDAQKAENREWLRASGSGTGLKDKDREGKQQKRASRPKTQAPSGSFKEYLQTGTGKSAKRIVNSEDKLAVISKRFQKSLEPISSMDVRNLIKTPPDDIFESLSTKYDQVLERTPRKQAPLSPSRIEELPMPQWQPLKSGSMKSLPFLDDTDTANRVQQIKIGGASSRSANASRTGSKTLAGLINFRSLLEIQSEEDQQQEVRQHKSSHAPTRRPSRWIEPSEDAEVIHLTGTEVHGTLQRSVKSIDQAAKIAQNLGNLMSKVALQQNGKQQERNNDTSLENKEWLKSNLTSTTNSNSTSMSTSVNVSASSSVSKGVGTQSFGIDPELKNLLDKDRKRNPYNPITDEIKKRADKLTEVVEKAEQNLKLHGAAFGFNSYPDSGRSGKNSPRNNDANKKKNPLTTFATTGTDAGAEGGFETESLRKIIDKQPSSEFEFVSDMSYTDQLMLKKLRGLKSNWDD